MESARSLVASGIIFPSAFQARTDENIFRELGKIVEKAMLPFQTGGVTLSISHAQGLNSRIMTLWVEVKTLRDYPFKFKFDRWILDLAYQPTGEIIFDSIADDLFKYFRYRPTLPIEEHIQLGED